jgi:hypothetical protein
MRYDNWDVILFPFDSGVPIKEFRVICGTSLDAGWFTVLDVPIFLCALTTPEFSLESEIRIPTMTCFIPSLECGRQFKVSIHSWVNHPEGSAFTKAKCTESSQEVKFEARVFIHGDLVAYASLVPFSPPISAYLLG